MIDLEELERLSKAATPGPWQIHKDHPANFVMESGSNPVRHISIPVGNREWMCDLELSWNQNCSNAAYITAACNSVPELIQRIRELEIKILNIEAEADILAEYLSPSHIEYWRKIAMKKREKK